MVFSCFFFSFLFSGCPPSSEKFKPWKASGQPVCNDRLSAATLGCTVSPSPSWSREISGLQSTKPIHFCKATASWRSCSSSPCSLSYHLFVHWQHGSKVSTFFCVFFFLLLTQFHLNTKLKLSIGMLPSPLRQLLSWLSSMLVQSMFLMASLLRRYQYFIHSLMEESFPGFCLMLYFVSRLRLLCY